ncbi:hypothetical protein HPP92_019436 [Vanilla planifolia]|uniref:Uncharacterized protein n=1 Tax=Vanilla planifolia TaxID=51239 RepID=A0A835Q9L1_VANPL|nr:hypothetical protein HPP92_019436 [Vanilla planifolia]
MDGVSHDFTSYVRSSNPAETLESLGIVLKSIKPVASFTPDLSFMVATYMIVLSSKAFNIAPLIPIAKLSLNEKTDEQSSLRKQLLSEFMPVDVCPLGAQLIESPPQIAPFDSKHDYASQEQVMPPLFVIDDDANVEVCERPEDPLLQLNTNSTCLLSINELLETVPDTTIEA